jgi:dTDP-4-amino-4,6-dideoxygalactose transaminase
MRAIAEIAKKHNLLVIEDNAQSIDGHGNGFAQGELSDALTVSFIIQKNLGCFGDGGAVVTNNAAVDSEVRRLRNHGSLKRNVHSFGFNSRLDDIHAGVLLAKIDHITEWTDQRRGWAAKYSEGLKDCAAIELPYEAPGVRHVYHLYVIETKDSSKRDDLLCYLQDNGIDAKTHYSIPIHLQDGYPWGKDAEIRGKLTNVEKNAASCISLPMYPELTQEEVDYVIATVKKWDSKNA